MWRIYQAMKDRMSQYLLAETTLTADASAGDISIQVSDTTDLGYQGMNNSYPTVLFMDNNTTGQRISGGFEGTEEIDIDLIYGNNIQFKTPLQNDWLISNTAKIKRAPAGVPVDSVIVGDVAVIPKFSTVCVVPTDKSIDWWTLSGTRDTVNIDFMVYVTDDDTESATIYLLKLADVVEWILMSNLHIQPEGYTKDREVTSKAMVTRVQYSTIAKGSEFLKAATLTWNAELFFWRGYLTSQGALESPLDGPLT